MKLRAIRRENSGIDSCAWLPPFLPLSPYIMPLPHFHILVFLPDATLCTRSLCIKSLALFKDLLREPWYYWVLFSLSKTVT